MNLLDFLFGCFVGAFCMWMYMDVVAQSIRGTPTEPDPAGSLTMCNGKELGAWFCACGASYNSPQCRRDNSD